MNEGVSLLESYGNAKTPKYFFEQMEEKVLNNYKELSKSKQEHKMLLLLKGPNHIYAFIVAIIITFIYGPFFYYLFKMSIDKSLAYVLFIGFVSYVVHIAIQKKLGDFHLKVLLKYRKSQAELNKKRAGNFRYLGVETYCPKEIDLDESRIFAELIKEYKNNKSNRGKYSG